jgi:hypothetical protein
MSSLVVLSRPRVPDYSASSDNPRLFVSKVEEHRAYAHRSHTSESGMSRVAHLSKWVPARRITPGQLRPKAAKINRSSPRGVEKGRRSKCSRVFTNASQGVAEGTCQHGKRLTSCSDRRANSTDSLSAALSSPRPRRAAPSLTEAAFNLVVRSEGRHVTFFQCFQDVPLVVKGDSLFCDGLVAGKACRFWKVMRRGRNSRLSVIRLRRSDSFAGVCASI